jgi:superfamily II DNA/RNA helicase
MNLDIPIDEEVLNRLKNNGISSAFEIQELASKQVFDGKSVKIYAPTGSGKTLSYFLPLAARLATDDKLKLIILSSSPELASQIHTVFKTYFERYSSLLILGAANVKRQKERLKKKPRVIVGTPGRVFELFCLEYFDINEQTMLVLDEVDTLLDGRSYDKILSLVEGCGQLITASATYGKAAEQFLEECLFELEEISTQKREGVVKHAYLFCNDNKKDIALVKLIKQQKLKRVLLFINDLKYGRHLFQKLKDNDIKTLRLDSQIQKLDREKAIKEFKDGKVQVLLASDSLSRGVDFDGADVVQFNASKDIEVYVHRSGRTGRAGKTGTCISMITGKDAYILDKYKKALDITIDEIKFSSAVKKPFRKKVKPKKKK